MQFIKRIFIAFVLFSFLFASGEEVAIGRDVRTVYVNQEFTVSVYAPDKEKNPDYWYVLSDPIVSGRYVKYLRRENVEPTKGIDPKPGKAVYYFKAIERGESNINIYRAKKGEHSTSGLEYSVLIKVEE